MVLAWLGRSVAFLGAEACQEISFLGGLVAHNWDTREDGRQKHQQTTSKNMIRIQLTVWFTQADQETLPTRHFIMLTSVCGKTLLYGGMVWSKNSRTVWGRGWFWFPAWANKLVWWRIKIQARAPYKIYKPKTRLFLFGKALKPYTNPNDLPDLPAQCGAPADSSWVHLTPLGFFKCLGSIVITKKW